MIFRFLNNDIKKGIDINALFLMRKFSGMNLLNKIRKVLDLTKL